LYTSTITRLSYGNLPLHPPTSLAPPLNKSQVILLLLLHLLLPDRRDNTSTYVTTTTILSVYEANYRAASASLTSMGNSVKQTDFTTPAQATTALALSTDVIRPSSTTSDESLPTDEAGDQGGQGGIPSGPGGPGIGPVDVPGAGMQAGVPGWGVAWAFAAVVVAVVGGMMWL
jgi:hypothetical protein